MDLTKHWATSLDDYVIDLAWSPDNSLLAAASAAGPLTLFQSADGAIAHAFDGHPMGTNCVAFAPAQGAAGLLLASGGQDGAVKFWDASAGQHISTAQLGLAWVDHLAWRPNGRSGGSSLASPESGEPPLPLSR